MARARKPHETAPAGKPHETAPGDTPEDLAAAYERLKLEMQRLRLECKGLRHDNAIKTRERDTLLQENIALRKGEQHKQREVDLRWYEALLDRRALDLRQREEALDRRDAAQVADVTALRRQLRASETHLRLAKSQIGALQTQVSALEVTCDMLRMTILRDAERGAHHQGALVPKREIDRQLRELIRLCHPDKWHDAEVATELTKSLNRLRAEYAN